MRMSLSMGGGREGARTRIGGGVGVYQNLIDVFSFRASSMRAR